MLSFAPWIYAFEVSNVGAAPTERRLGAWLFGPLSLESSLRIALSDAEVHMVRTYLVHTLRRYLGTALADASS